jgi:hypothetical protein
MVPVMKKLLLPGRSTMLLRSVVPTLDPLKNVVKVALPCWLLLAWFLCFSLLSSDEGAWERNCNTYHIDSPYRGVGKARSGVEVVGGFEGDICVLDREASEGVEANNLHGLVKGHGVVPRDARHACRGVALDLDVDQLLVQEVRVEGGELGQVLDGDGLADVDDDQRVRRGLGEVDAGKRERGVDVCEVHGAGEAGDRRVDAPVRRDGGVDGHVQRGGLSLADGDAVNVENRGIEFLLRYLWYCDEETI